jgi:cyanophycin synthetase
LKINKLIIYNGRNIYNHRPCIKADVDLEEYYDTPTCDIPNFNNLLLEYIPTLREHKCARGYRGGFVDRLYEGTYLAHVLEHICIEIQNVLGYDISFGKARQTEHENIYTIIFEYENRVVAEEVIYLAKELVNDLCTGTINIKFQEKINKLKKIAASQNLGPSTQAILEDAQSRGIPILYIGNGSLLQLGYGCFGKRIQATITENTGCIPVDIACDKKITKELLSTAGIPVPAGYISDDLEDILDYMKRIGYPVVIKPNHGNQGKGVSLNLTDDEHISSAFHIAKEFCDQVVVEKYIPGCHYRMLVVDGKFIACAQRIAAHVIGNGKNNIRELIELENQNPLRGEEHEKPLTKLKLDSVMELLLKKNNMDLDMIPSKGEVVFLRENDNLSTGGIAIDVTDKVHPQNIEIAINAANIIGLDVAGIDVTTKDISSSMLMDGGAVIEVNAAPGIRMHHYPTQGKQRNVARKIVDSLFPKNSQYTIPIISITGTNGKTTITRMLGKILMERGWKVGMTTTGGIYIDQQCIMKGDTTGALSAQSVLMDKRVEAAIFETARGGIIKKGLGYDLADVGIVTNISEDHLGLDGINTLEQLAHVKSLVVEAIQATGYAVLNADDPYCIAMTKNISTKIIYFSNQKNQLIIGEHMRAGGKAVYIKNNCICIFDGKTENEILPIKEIPATLNGLLECNIKNSLAAVAGAYGLGIEPKIIAQGLRKFKADIVDNPGRFNIHSIRDFKVVVDYGHNIEGYREVISTLKKMQHNRLIGVIGVPGDRSETSTVKIGQLCGENFHHIIIKEDKEKRTLERGSISKFLKNGCMISGMNKEKIEIELCEKDALKKALKMAKANDIVVVFFEDYEEIMETIKEVKSQLEKENLNSLNIKSNA